jgi:hypothetical protein
MQRMSITMDQARTAKDKAKSLFKSHHWSATAIGIGRKGDDLAVKINLEKPRIDDDMPREINGVPVIYEVVGTIVARARGRI